MQAACGLAQIEKLPNFIDIRKKNFRYLLAELNHLENYLILPEPTKQADPSWFGFPITLKDSSPVNRRDFLKYLDQERVGTRLLFAGNLTRQPYFQNQVFKVHGPLTNTDKVMDDTFWIGVQPSLQSKALEYTVDRIKNFLDPKF
jgi:CDP-6-deoxy-D-xylo-4-hexulose-3-dehydrase